MGFDPVSYLMGKAAGGGGGGGIPLLTSAEWDALSTAEKQAYGLVAIQNASSGYARGELVYGADYAPVVSEEMVPIYSWNTSDNKTNTYSFSNVTLAERPTTHCLALMSQNGTNPEWSVSPNLLPARADGSQGNGSWAICYGEKAAGDYASTLSTGDNWNNSGIVCFCLSGDVLQSIIETFYVQGTTGTYTYTHTASDPEKLLLIAMRGGSSAGSYSVTGLTLKSSVTSSGARFNNVYYGELQSGEELSVSIPYEAGGNNNGSLFVALLRLG